MLNSLALGVCVLGKLRIHLASKLRARLWVLGYGNHAFKGVAAKLFKARNRKQSKLVLTSWLAS